MTNQKTTDALGNPTVELECPECGHEERASIGPTLSLSFESEITITRITCKKCGYDGPPNPEDG